MKIYSISILYAPPSSPPIVLSNANDLSPLSFFQRGSAAEFMAFLSTTVAERTLPGQRQTVQNQSYVAHIYNRGGEGKLAAVIITDEEYPARPAFSLLTKILDEFMTKVPQSTSTTSGYNPSSISFPEINTYIKTYQDPRQTDTITRVQQELDETKIALHKTIESVLRRGEKLDNLVERSKDLSMQTKSFYRTAKKQNNSCCIIM